MNQKMHVWILLTTFFVFLAGCGGGGEDGKVISTTGNITSSGGTLKLSDGAQATFDTGVLTGATTVSMTRVAASSPAEGEPVAVSPSYTVELPVASIAPPADDASSFGKGITLQIPVSSDLSGKVAGLLSSVSNDAYKFVKITIEDADTPKMTGKVVRTLGLGQKMKLAASYVVSAGNAVVHITQDSLSTAADVATSVNMKITATIIDTRNFFVDVNNFYSVGPELYAVNSSTDFVKLSEPLNLYGRMPVILVHGWQIFDNYSYKPYKDAWKNFIDYYYSDPDLKKNFVLLSFRYDSDRRIDENAADLGRMIEQIIPGSQQVILIGHSMGGLVSHAYLQKHNGLAKVRKLITLGTPYHGSPVVQAAKGLVDLTTNSNTALAIDAFLTLSTPGTLDLAWDGFDHNMLILSGNDYLQELNNNNMDLGTYVAFAGTMHPDDSHSGKYNNGNRLLWLLRYGDDYKGNDGIVPAVSAFRMDHSNGAYVEMPLSQRTKDNYDHTQIHDGRIGYLTEPLYQEIKTELTATLPPPPPSITGTWTSTMTTLSTTCSANPLQKSSTGTYSQNGTALNVLVNTGEVLTGTINGDVIYLTETLQIPNPNDFTNPFTMNININATINSDYNIIIGTFDANGICSASGTINVIRQSD